MNAKDKRPTPPEHEPMTIESGRPLVFPAVHEISSTAIIEGIWVDGKLRLRIDPRDGEPVTLDLDPTGIRGFIQFLQQMQEKQP